MKLSIDSDYSSANITKSITRIFYCSRTHSQVKQMIATLKNTPYRPRMAVLGSREKLCIHEDIRPRDGSKTLNSSSNVNHECRIRVENTEKFRRAQMKSDVPNGGVYNDELPPVSLPGDRHHHETKVCKVSVNENDFVSRSQCSHYRSLTNTGIAKSTVSNFRPTDYHQECCNSDGAKDTKAGVYDIEDLVSFGLNPYVTKKSHYTACPYYLSQALAKDADLVFAPYNVCNFLSIIHFKF